MCGRLLGVRVESVQFDIVHARFQAGVDQLGNCLQVIGECALGVFNRRVVIAQRFGNPIAGSECRLGAGLNKIQEWVRLPFVAVGQVADCSAQLAVVPVIEA